MKKFIRRAMLLALVIAVALVAGGVFIHLRMMRKPKWYAHPVLDPRVQAQAGDSADQKLFHAFSAVNDARAAQTRARQANPTTSPVATMPEPITLVLSEDEINAFFEKWKRKMRWDHLLGKYLEDPVLVIDGKELILAATVKGKWNAVMSLHFTPRLEDGKLNLAPLTVMAGTVQVPQALFSGYIQKINEMLDSALPNLRDEAEINPRGWANRAAVDAAACEFLERIVNDQPAEPAIFFPEVGRDARSLPARIIAVDISDKTLTLKVQLMDADEREALLQRIRGE